jgi:hypothetical protein
MFGMLAMALLVLHGAARADEAPGVRIMRQMDESMTRATDQYFIQEITTQEPGKDPRVMTWEVHIKGTEWRRVDFKTPGDVKGMRVLIRSLTQMYVYLPAYRKVRRVASHVRGQGFMGMTLSHDDASIVHYSPVYVGKLIAETDTHWTIEGTRREGQSFPYAKMEFDVLKSNYAPSGLRYFNDKGVMVKSEKRSQFKCQEDICSPMILRMTDHTRNDMWTELVTKEWKINTGVKDSYFTVRALQRRR